MDLHELIHAATIDELDELFPGEIECIRYLQKNRWKNTVISPFADSSKIYSCKDNRFRCNATGKYFNAKTNTLFHNTKIPLAIWFRAIWLAANFSKVTSVALANELNLTQKTAWLMLRRINRFLNENGYRTRVKSPYPKTVKNNLVETVNDNRLPMSEWLNMLKQTP